MRREIVQSPQGWCVREWMADAPHSDTSHAEMCGPFRSREAAGRARLALDLGLSLADALEAGEGEDAFKPARLTATTEQWRQVVAICEGIVPLDTPMIDLIRALWTYQQAHPDNTAGLVELVRAVVGQIAHVKAVAAVVPNPEEKGSR